MNQRGFVIEGYMYLIGAIAILGLIAAIGYGFKSYIDGVATENFEAGELKERGKWQARESKELADANAKILELTEQARTAERAAQVAVTEANNVRRKASEEAKKRIPVVASTVAAGLGRMCDPGTAAGQNPGSDPARPVAADPERLAGIDRSDVLANLGIALSNEAARADDYARKLIQAVALLKLDRETCQ